MRALSILGVAVLMAGCGSSDGDSGSQLGDCGVEQAYSSSLSGVRLELGTAARCHVSRAELANGLSIPLQLTVEADAQPLVNRYACAAGQIAGLDVVAGVDSDALAAPLCAASLDSQPTALGAGSYQSTLSLDFGGAPPGAGEWVLHARADGELPDGSGWSALALAKFVVTE